MKKAIVMALLLMAILLVSGCTTRQQIATTEFDEPNDWHCKADCINWCKNEGSEVIEYYFNEPDHLCTCNCYVET